MTGFNYAPAGWALCNGQILRIQEYPALFTLLGTRYGGDGVNTFALPDLRSRVPVHKGFAPDQNIHYRLGERGGGETVTLQIAELPVHAHRVLCNNNVTAGNPAGKVWGKTTENQYSKGASNQTLNPACLTPSGQGQPHDNLPPVSVISFMIALKGYYPSAAGSREGAAREAAMNKHSHNL